MIVIISGDNVALLTDYVVAPFQGPKDMVHRDKRGVSKAVMIEATLNLGMLFSTQRNGQINLRSMVQSISP